MCGLPGYSAAIHFELYDQGHLLGGYGAAAAAELLEASGLLVALRALADIPGVVDPAAAPSGMAKIEAAAGIVADDDAVSAEDDPAPIEAEAATAVRQAPRLHSLGGPNHPATTGLTRRPPASSTRSGAALSATTAIWSSVPGGRGGSAVPV